MDALVLTPAIAEVFLALAAIGLVLVAAFGGDPDKTASLMRRLSIGVLVITGLLTNAYGAAPDLAFGHMFITSPFTVYMKLLVLIGAIVVVVVSKPHLRADGIHKPEFYLLILLSVLGMMVVISANDLMVLYMGVELQWWRRCSATSCVHRKPGLNIFCSARCHRGFCFTAHR